MDKTEIKHKMKDILVSILKHENMSMEDTMTASEVKGWDSLSHMIIIKEIESTFNIRFKLKDLNKLVDMGSLIALVETKISS